MFTPKDVNGETSPLLGRPNRPHVYSRSLSQEQAILGGLSKSKQLYGKYILYARRWYVLLVLFVLNVSNAMVSPRMLGNEYKLT